MRFIADHIAAYIAANTERPLSREPETFNIVYVEGASIAPVTDEPTFEPNDNALDGWNDLRLLLSYNATREAWVADLIAEATTSPGRLYTKKPLNRGGAAMLAFGYHPPAWAEGLHKGTQPALVQVGAVKIHRDVNRDGKRNPNEVPYMSRGNGINHHGTRKGYAADSIGAWSAGCAVGKSHDLHITFIQICRMDARRMAADKAKRRYLYDCWLLPGDAVADFAKNIVV